MNRLQAAFCFSLALFSCNSLFTDDSGEYAPSVLKTPSLTGDLVCALGSGGPAREIKIWWGRNYAGFEVENAELGARLETWFLDNSQLFTIQDGQRQLVADLSKGWLYAENFLKFIFSYLPSDLSTQVQKNIVLVDEPSELDAYIGLRLSPNFAGDQPWSISLTTNFPGQNGKMNLPRNWHKPIPILPFKFLIGADNRLSADFESGLPMAAKWKFGEKESTLRCRASGVDQSEVMKAKISRISALPLVDVDGSEQIAFPIAHALMLNIAQTDMAKPQTRSALAHVYAAKFCFSDWLAWSKGIQGKKIDPDKRAATRQATQDNLENSKREFMANLNWRSYLGELGLKNPESFIGGAYESMCSTPILKEFDKIPDEEQDVIPHRH